MTCKDGKHPGLNNTTGKCIACGEFIDGSPFKEIMTKEQQSLVETIAFWSKDSSHAQNILIGELTKFFDSNVCILKGSNRHPDADVLHEAIEGKQLQHGIHYCDNRGRDEIIFEDIKLNFSNINGYRIKPSEPQYEWLWKYPSHDFEATTDKYLTVEEVDKIGIKFWCKTETKRERK